MQYGAPPPGPPPVYPLPGARSALPVVAGVLSIIFFSIYTLFALLGLVGGAAADDTDGDKGPAIVVVVLMLAWNVAGIIMGAYACKRRWWAALVAGILHTISGLIYLIAALAFYEAADKVESLGGINAGEVDTVGHVCLVLFFITALLAVLCFVAIPKARRDGAPVAPHQVAQQF